jgi:hypothetical protein
LTSRLSSSCSPSITTTPASHAALCSCTSLSCSGASPLAMQPALPL